MKLLLPIRIIYIVDLNMFVKFPVIPDTDHEPESSLLLNT